MVDELCAHAEALHVNAAAQESASLVQDLAAFDAVAAEAAASVRLCCGNTKLGARCKIKGSTETPAQSGRWWCKLHVKQAAAPV